jgi:uncharacterized membrane protein SpoIIM required for sporulation
VNDLRSQTFRAEREGEWRRLERLLSRLERGRPTALSTEDLLAIPVLYRATLSSLSVARSTALDHSLIDYLESLSARAYFFVYGGRSTLLQRLGRFFAHDWPAAVRGLWRETLLAAAITVLGVVLGYVLTAHSPEWYASLMPGDMADGRDTAASTQFLRDGLYHSGPTDGLSVFATYLFTHNAQIALMAFALGFAFCLPTAWLLLTNGLTLGAMIALYVQHGLGWKLGGWLMIHGVTELSAVILAGAAGFRIGWSLIFPGLDARLDAAVKAGRQAATAMAGVVCMLVVAGLLEGFGRQLIVIDAARYAIAGASALLWAVYFYWPRRTEPTP